MWSFCPKQARIARWTFFGAGLLSLVWFVFRVAPKPSRAAYPCQRAAAPLAGGFVIWMAGVLGAAALYQKGKDFWRHSRTALASIFLIAAAASAISVLLVSPQPAAQANTPNQPAGAGKGIYPGRVVWAHDPAATTWAGPGDGHWWESNHTSQAAVDGMVSGALRRLTGRSGDAEAWDALIRHFNRAQGRGDTGYTKGEKIVIKVNFVGCIVGGNVDPKTYEMVRRPDYMNTSPQVIVALLRQLVKGAGADQQDITVGDPLSLFPKEYHDICRREFPNVRYLDHDGGNENHVRSRAEFSQVPFYWSSRPTGKTQDYVPVQYAEAKYLINLANLKSHVSAGVTLCAKNHYGSLIRKPPEEGYYDMHGSMAKETPASGRYRAMVDLMGHAHVGGKTLLYLIDGLYPGVHPSGASPSKWSSAPFNGDWASSLLASQDPVAIDSVGFDFLWAEWNDYPHMPGADDYLHEAAQADNPPSGTFYDPNHATNVARLASLGVHEHWNNAAAKQYSRNLDGRAGIELVRAR
jgi:uncharacterized protein (DUF362 family)